MENPWYINPAWYALFISVLSLVVSYFNWKYSRRCTRSDIEKDLVIRATEINELFLKYKVKGPYALHLKVPEEKVHEFTAKAVMLLNQINLLRDVYQHRDILEQKVVDSYVTWATTVLRPWIESDEDLKSSWKLLRDSKDMVREDFVKWLQPLLPII